MNFEDMVNSSLNGLISKIYKGAILGANLEKDFRIIDRLMEQLKLNMKRTKNNNDKLLLINKFKNDLIPFSKTAVVGLHTPIDTPVK